MKRQLRKDIFPKGVYPGLKSKIKRPTPKLITKISPPLDSSEIFRDIDKELSEMTLSIDSDEKSQWESDPKNKIFGLINNFEPKAVIDPPKITATSTNASFNRSYSSNNLNDSKEHGRYKKLEIKYKALQHSHNIAVKQYEREIEYLKNELNYSKEKTPYFKFSENQSDTREILMKLLEEIGNLQEKVQNLETTVIKLKET
ncbi:unnamed protein product [Blepharisma stoltei]|uniref:Uncharacterized protein n=1 Tax=Blepharisma stoltei TaxID=1481888 RepID=A0AAU9JFV0_9CILI|nr:unnamed protein product [Blepharisma stoltei]